MPNKSLDGYYLVRILDNEKYLDDLINGINFRINSVQVFRDKANKFQGDKNECSIIVNGDTIKGKFAIGKEKPEKILCDADINEFGLNGYIYCFFAIPKEFFYLEKNELMMDDKSDYYNDFIKTLNSYYENCNSKKCYIGIFDANKLVTHFKNCFVANNYKFGYDFVKYKKISTAERFKYLFDKELYKIVFEKDESYSYQREFRFFITNIHGVEYLDINNVLLKDALKIRFELNPKGLQKLIRSNNNEV